MFKHFLVAIHKISEQNALLCSVNQLDQTDISLLFKSLVVLPVDRSESQKLPITVAPEKSTNTKVEDSLSNSVSEPDTKYVVKKHPFVILIKGDLKEQYLQTGSSFFKITSALNIPQASKYLKAFENTTDIHMYKCVWCIHLNLAEEKSIRSMAHDNLIISPDILTLKTSEEKKQMYSPLKNFISSNLESISQI